MTTDGRKRTWSTTNPNFGGRVANAITKRERITTASRPSTYTGYVWIVALAVCAGTASCVYAVGDTVQCCCTVLGFARRFTNTDGVVRVVANVRKRKCWRLDRTKPTAIVSSRRKRTRVELNCSIHTVFACRYSYSTTRRFVPVKPIVTFRWNLLYTSER